MSDEVDWFSSLDAARACELVREAGIDVSPSDVRVEARDGRWAVFLPGERMAWIASSEDGARRLAIERKVLRVLEARCTFEAPRILVERGPLDVRRIVAGSVDPWAVYARLEHDRDRARAIGRSIGAILVEQHTRIAFSDVAGWLPEAPEWPMPRDEIRTRVREVTSDRDLVAAIDDALAAYHATPVTPEDRVLVHADLGFHNLAFDERTLEVRGVFDYEDAAWADRHHDFRYLVFDRKGEEMLDAAIAVYEPKTGRAISRERVRLYNAACAASFLAFRTGVAPDAKSCGRTLEEDLRWIRHALAGLGFSSAVFT
jgi:aminoglycoside phosphotransferase (APT) family kinase protein